MAGATIAGWLIASVVLRVLGLRARMAASIGWFILVIVAAPIIRAIWPDDWRPYFVWFLIATPSILLIVWSVGRPTRLRERRR
jgi:hypothetical protein